MDYLLAQAKEEANKGIPIVPLDSEGQQRLISKRGAICTCAAAVACMGSGLGFGTLIPADQTPQIVQLQKELESAKQNITTITELALEGDEDSSLLTSLEEKKDKLERDNEVRKANQIDQNNTILKLQEEKNALTLQIDKQLEEIKKLKKENWDTKVDLEIESYHRVKDIIELTEENKELHSQLRKITGEGLKQLLVKFCNSSKWTALGRIYGNKTFTKIDCAKFTEDISSKLT